MTHKGKSKYSVLAVMAFALVFVLVASLAGAFFNKAMSEQAAATRGPYMIAPAGDDRLSIWRIDQTTGRVSYCMRDSQSQDPKFIASRAPFCSAWSAE